MQARLAKKDWRVLFKWFQQEVNPQKWMQALRMAGIGNSSKQSKQQVTKVAALIRRWVKVYNSHNKKKPLQFVELIDLGSPDGELHFSIQISTRINFSIFYSIQICFSIIFSILVSIQIIFSIFSVHILAYI